MSYGPTKFSGLPQSASPAAMGALGLAQGFLPAFLQAMSQAKANRFRQAQLGIAQQREARQGAKDELAQRRTEDAMVQQSAAGAEKARMNALTRPYKETDAIIAQHRKDEQVQDRRAYQERFRNQGWRHEVQQKEADIGRSARRAEAVGKVRNKILKERNAGLQRGAIEEANRDVQVPFSPRPIPPDLQGVEAIPPAPQRAGLPKAERELRAQTQRDRSVINMARALIQRDEPLGRNHARTAIEAIIRQGYAQDPRTAAQMLGITSATELVDDDAPEGLR